MVYEAEIRIRRDDPRVLADDFQAVTALLEQRKADREAQGAGSKGRHRLELVTSSPARA